MEKLKGLTFSGLLAKEGLSIDEIVSALSLSRQTVFGYVKEFSGLGLVEETPGFRGGKPVKTYGLSVRGLDVYERIRFFMGLGKGVFVEKGFLGEILRFAEERIIDLMPDHIDKVEGDRLLKGIEYYRGKLGIT